MRTTVAVMLASVACDPVTIADVVRDGGPFDGLRTVEIPVVGQEEVSTYAILGLKETRGEDALSSEVPISLAFGEAYPTDLSLVIEEMYLGRCTVEADAWSVAEVRSTDPSVLTASVERGEVRVQVIGPGEAELVVEGMIDAPDGFCWMEHEQARFPTTLSYNVVVSEPVGGEIVRPYGCEGDEGGAPLVLISEQPSLGVLVPYARSSSERVSVANAAPYRQAHVTLVLDDGVEAELVEPDRGLAGVRFSGSGRVEAHVGDVMQEIRIAQPDEITDIEMHFVLPWGTGRSHLEMEDGETYDAHRLPQGRVVMPQVGLPSVEGVPACSHPSSDWFAFSSDPELPVEDYVDRSYGYPMHLGFVTDLPAGDWTELELSAPDLNGGEGLAHQIRVQIVEGR